MVDVPTEVDNDMMKSEVNLVNYKAVDPSLQKSIRKSIRVKDPEALLH